LAASSAVPVGSFWSNALLSATEVAAELPSTNDLKDSLFRKATTNAVRHTNGRISICQGNDFFKFNRFEDNRGEGMIRLSQVALYSDKSPDRILPGAANVVEYCDKNPQNRQYDPPKTHA
jgi:hypothetical protein